MATDPVFSKKIKPLWQQNPQKFEAAHRGEIIFELQQMAASGKLPGLSKFVASYLKDLPEDLPAAVVVEIAKWAAAEWEVFAAEKTAVPS